MTDFAVATEDALSEAVAETLLRQTGGHVVQRRIRRNGYGYLKTRIGAFNQMAKTVMPVLLVTDLDRWTCPPELIADWLPSGSDPRLLFRVAVRETESWLLADRHAFAEFLGIPTVVVPERPDDLVDPKAALLKLVRKAKRRDLKQDILPARGVSFPVGLGYNDRLIRFVREGWDSRRAAQVSVSLARAVAPVARFNTGIADQ